MNMPYMIATPYYWNSKETNKIRYWLADNIGDPYRQWKTDAVNDRLCVLFHDKQDALLFALKWL